MTESKEHLELKSEAREILNNFGCLKIEEEVRFGNMVVDVVGYKKNEIIIIECGTVYPRNRLDKLKKFKKVSRVINIPHKNNLAKTKIKIQKIKILEFLRKEKKRFNIKQLSKKSEVPYSTTCKYCDILFAEGKIELQDFGNVRLVNIWGVE